MAQGAHKITEQFEQELCKYTGAPYAVAVDNCSNALFLALYYELHVKENHHYPCYDGDKPTIQVPCNTYPSVPCEVIHAGGKVEFINNKRHLFCPGIAEEGLNGSYRLMPTNVWDSALSFTTNMYLRGQHMCVSFTGPYKHLKLGKGGAILTDDFYAYNWFKRARFSGRQECSYFIDDFDSLDRFGIGTSVAGWNFYMMPEIAARGILLIQQFYDREGKPKQNEDLCLPYPDLSKFKIFQQ
jgi:dTDP-4-amino-4,6-dideoxygalactose transaminase